MQKGAFKMSNEYKDWKNDIMATLNDKMWEAEFLPEGWVDTFVPELKNELADALGSYVDDFVVLQIKEKYGALRMYWHWADKDYADDEAKDLSALYNEIEAVIGKYERISEKTCVVCGADATKFTTAWVLPVCDEHECF